MISRRTWLRRTAGAGGAMEFSAIDQIIDASAAYRREELGSWLAEEYGSAGALH